MAGSPVARVAPDLNTSFSKFSLSALQLLNSQRHGNGPIKKRKIEPAQVRDMKIIEKQLEMENKYEEIRRRLPSDKYTEGIFGPKPQERLPNLILRNQADGKLYPDMSKLSVSQSPTERFLN